MNNYTIESKLTVLHNINIVKVNYNFKNSESTLHKNAHTQMLKVIDNTKDVRLSFNQELTSQ